MNETNQNGHQKAFELVTPRTPEEIAQDSFKTTMPKLRRACSKDSRLRNFVGAKWLFGVLTDNSFLNDHGGDGWGKVYTSLKELHREYGHEEDTLAVWRDKLIETGWIWFQKQWPVSCWGIAGVTRQPELFSPHRNFIRVMAKASGQEQPPTTVPLQQNDKNSNSGHNDRIPLADQPSVTVRPTASDGQTNRSLRLHQPPELVDVGGQNQLDQPPMTVTPAANDGQNNREDRVGQTEGAGHTKETPPENGVRRDDAFKRSTGFNASKAAGGAKKLSPENAFLSDIDAMMESWRKGSSKAELMNSGGGWRSRFRQNPDLVQRVMAEIRCMIREGKIKKHPGAAAVDLWNRWSKEVSLKQKAAVRAAA